MSYQEVLHQAAVEERESKTQTIESQRNTAAVNYKTTIDGAMAGLTVRDWALRTVQVKLDIDGIDQLIEELKIARAQLEYAALLAKLRPQS